MSDYFMHKGKRWTRISARAVDRWIVGVDLGQAIDYTATCVLHHTVTPAPADAEWIVDEKRHTTTQRAETRFDILHLQRFELGEPYPVQVEKVKGLLARPPLRDGASLIVDSTGVGKAVVDIFVQAGLRPVQVCITGGFDPIDHGQNRWSVPKVELVSALDARLNTGELRFAPALREAGALADELKDFQRHVSAAGRNTYNARIGSHDDLVLSVALALWWATKPSRGEFSQGYVKGLCY